MTYTIAAVINHDSRLQTRPDLTRPTDTKFVNLGKDISQLDTFLSQFNKPDNELLNPIMRGIFEGICRAFESIQRDVGQINDCHFSGLDQVSSLKPRIDNLEALYQTFDHAEELRSEFDNQVNRMQHLFQTHQNPHKGGRAISKCFEGLPPLVKNAQGSEFSIFSTFQDEMKQKNDWMTKIIEETTLFSCPKSLKDTFCTSAFLRFCASLFSEQSENGLTTFADFLPDLRKPFGVSDEANAGELLKVLKDKILSNQIKKLKNPQLFFDLLRKVAWREKIQIQFWDKDWAKNNWKKHLEEYPCHVLLALHAYETCQLNESLKFVWENLLKKTSISAHDQWPTCARLLRTVKQNSSVFLMQKAGDEIYERALHSHSIDELIDELVIRNNIYNSICSVQKRISQCYPILNRLDEQLTMIGIALLAHPRPMSAEQKIKLENACQIFLALIQESQQRQYTPEDVNFLIEFVTAVFLSDFYSTPSFEINLNQDLIDQKVSAIHSSKDPGYYPLQTSDAELVFYPCSIQVASRIDVAAKIARTLKLPISEMKLVNYAPLDMKKELKRMIKEWTDKIDTTNDSLGFDELVEQLEALPSPFATQIKDFIGRCISGNEMDESELGNNFFKKISSLPLAEAKTKMKEVMSMIREYSNSVQFKSACTQYDQSHPPLIGLAFPHFDHNQDVSQNFKKRSTLPTPFKHLWALFNLVAGNLEAQDSCRLFFNDSKDDPSLLRFIEISSYFSSASSSYRDDLALDSPFAPQLLETLNTSRILEDVKTHLKFQVGLASGPLDQALKRIEIIKTTIEEALREDTVITPNMLISATAMV